MNYLQIKNLRLNVVLILMCAVLLSIFFVSPKDIEGEEMCSLSVKLVMRNEKENFLTNIPFAIYQQVKDPDGNPKPSKIVASGKTNEFSGWGKVSFNSEGGAAYALKVWDKNSEVGEFWYYDNFLACGETIEINKILSGIKVVLRDADNVLKKNYTFSLYTQRYDTDGNPIKEKDDYVGDFNTELEGEKNVYLASKPRSIDGKSSGYYIIEAKGENSGIFDLYNIKVADEKMTNINYVFSDFKFLVEDVEGNVYPANTAIEVFKQILDHDGEPAIGDKAGSTKTDDKGVAFFEYPKGTYAARLKDKDGQYNYFWNLSMKDQQRNNVVLTTTANPAQGECEANSGLTVIAKNTNGKYVPGIKFELYEQAYDINNKPIPGASAVKGTIESSGEKTVYFNPDPRKSYILNLYDKNQNVGDFWFYDNIKFYCDEDKTITKTLSSIKFILRDGEGNLQKGQKFSLYTQRFDVDGNPIKEKEGLVGNLQTSNEGVAVIYVAGDHPYDSKKKGKYVFSAQRESGVEYVEYDINVSKNKEVLFEYTFSDIIVQIQDVQNKFLADTFLDFYIQDVDSQGNYKVNKKIKTVKADHNGEVRFEYPYGSYAVKVKDDIGGYIEFWDIDIKNNQRSKEIVTTNLAKVRGKADGILPEGTGINIYNMIIDDDGVNYYQSKKLGAKKVGANGYAEIILKPGVYLFTISYEKNIYGKALYIGSQELYDITIGINQDNLIKKGQKFYVGKLPVQENLVEKLEGFILLQVEEHGEAWYVDKKSRLRYYMKDGLTAYEMMRKFGLGITNKNLSKIPVGLDSRFVNFDTDEDGLADKMEEAIGTDVYDSDSDGDGYNDGMEVKNGYNPLGDSIVVIDNNLSKKMKGNILLQVESKGEAWYINPKDGKRYYMKDGENAYNIMRFLSLGITNQNLKKIRLGNIK